MNDDAEIYGLKAKLNQFKTMRQRIVRPVNIILAEPELELDVVYEAEAEVEDVVNDDFNVNIVSAKVVAITKAKLQAIAKVVDPAATANDTV
jgi:hypothetical protein